MKNAIQKRMLQRLSAGSSLCSNEGHRSRVIMPITGRGPADASTTTTTTTTTTTITTRTLSILSNNNASNFHQEQVIHHYHYHHHHPKVLMMNQKQKQQQQQNRTHFTYADGPGTFDGTSATSDTIASTSLSPLELIWSQRDFTQRGFTVGIGGPVGSGKTALVLQLCRALYNHNNTSSNVTSTNLAVVTNDIFTQEDCEFLIRNNALPYDRIRAVETGGCPHAAIREDVSSNLSALEELTKQHYHYHNQDQDKTSSSVTASQPLLLLCESGGDNLAANFSRELADLTIYVIDVAGGDKVPRKGGPGITQSDLLIINKIDLAAAVGANLEVMKNDANTMRQYKTKNTNPTTSTTKGTNDTSSEQPVVDEVLYGPTYFCSIKNGIGIPEIIQFIQTNHQRAIQVSSLVSAFSKNNNNLANGHNHDHNHHHSHDR